MYINKYLQDENLNICLGYVRLIEMKLIDFIFKKVLLEESLFDLQTISYKEKIEHMKSEEFTSIGLCLENYGISKKRPISIASLYSNEKKIVKEWIDFSKYHQLFKNGFLPIGLVDHPQSSLLLIGIKEDNFRQIWVEVSNSLTCFKLGDSIFDFLSKLEFVDDDFLIKKLQGKQLYKNMTESFWRVK